MDVPGMVRPTALNIIVCVSTFENTAREDEATAVNIFIMNECKKRESDAPAEPYRAATGRSQARGAVFAAAKSSAGALPSRPVFSLVKTLIKDV